jgi:PAS domain S-box-containing protein
MGSLRILIVDDHETVRRGIRSLLSSRRDWVVCGESEDGLEAVEKVKSLRPDVVLMDISMPRMDGLEATRIIRREVPESKVIIVSQNDPAVVSSQAAEIGAAGYVNKDDLARDLLPTVDSVVADRRGEKTKKVRAPTDTRKGVSKRTLGRRAGDLLAAIVDSSDDAIISKTLDGVITSWNNSAERLFGYTREEAVGQHITLIIPEDRRDEEAKIVEQLRRGERVDHFETVRVRKDGTLLDLSLTISPVKDATGRAIGASKVARDITQRKQIEQALAERARLLDLSNDAIFVRDEADRVTYWNRSAFDLYGYTREEAVGRVSHELLRTEFPEALDRIIEQLHHDNRWTGELIHTHKDGSRIVVASRWALDRDDRGNRRRILETNNDITQQKRNEKALRESEERLRTLSDGLEVQVRARTQELEERNAEILQQSDQLRELSNRLLKTQDDERRRIARELHDSAGQLITVLGMNIAGIAKHGEQNPSLAEIVEDTQNLVQQLSREIRTTSYLLHPPLLDENGLSQAIHWYMQGLTERTDLDIELNIPENFGRLPADLELTIFRIVQEGLTNIHRHSGSKTATIRLSRNANSVLLKIEDHGKGISPEKLVAIRAQRTGVGITGMRERVRHLKGAMDIQSNGMGATISVTFPIPVIPTSIATSGSDRILQSLEATG